VSDIWVVNASPIIALAKVGHLQLLLDLSKELFVPEAVVAEILAGPASDPAKLALEHGWEAKVVADRIAPELLEWGLGAGETAVLAVATDRKPATAVLDDAAARKCAKALGIEVMGTMGVILRARKKGFIPSAADALKALQAAGLRLNDNMVRTVLKGIGEMWE
jgi:predicted nucleic acid-binding protein